MFPAHRPTDCRAPAEVRGVVGDEEGAVLRQQQIFGIRDALSACGAKAVELREIAMNHNGYGVMSKHS